MSPVDLSKCYGCGSDNPIGFHLKKSYASGRAHIEFEVRPEHCSYPGLMHGGITCVLMDEAMYCAVAGQGSEAVTVSMAVRYRRPALAGRRLTVEAWVKGREEKNIEVSATIVDALTGEVIAEGTGQFREVDLQRFMGQRSDPPRE